jgi:hypothetical protein
MKLRAPLVAVWASAFALPALAQNPYDPPTAVRPAPNLALLMNATRTVTINARSCGSSSCHAEPGGNDNWPLWQWGWTRIQLARRALTGGFAWNNGPLPPLPAGWTDPGEPDANISHDGIMDTYTGVRYGVFYFDGLGTRTVLNPGESYPGLTMNDSAQRAVIDFGAPIAPGNFGFGEQMGGPNDRPQVGLGSFLPFNRTTACCGNQPVWAGNTTWATNGPEWQHPWSVIGDGDDHVRTSRRVNRALQYVQQYFQHGASPPPFTVPNISGVTMTDFFHEGALARDNGAGNFIDSDVANTMVSGTAGCRRNFTVLVTDGHGTGLDCNATGTCTAPTTVAGLNTLQAAASIPNTPAQGNVTLPANMRNQLFVVHFGPANFNESNAIADCGYDGQCGNGIGAAFLGSDAATGEIRDLSALRSAFSAVFEQVFSGNYVTSAPVVSRYGDAVVQSWFEIRDYAAAVPPVPPQRRNLGRPGHVEYRTIDPTTGAIGPVAWDAGNILRNQNWAQRRIFTINNNGPTRCGPRGGCALGDRTATQLSMSGTTPATPTLMIGADNGGTDAAFLLGDPLTRFANGVLRSDTDGDVNSDDSYKLMDTGNSQPVIVGAPSGIGEDVTRWTAFLSSSLPRNAAFNGDGGAATVRRRDQVVYMGSNDGILHAFLSGVPSVGLPPPGRSLGYDQPATCAVPGGNAQVDFGRCAGNELWGYAPRALQNQWRDIRGGHFFMVDGSPVVSDVLFTKNSATPGPVCTTYDSPACANVWEYRTVLVNCLAGGGSVCFALDVTNPYDPSVLWERDLEVSVPSVRQTTSKPQIARVRRTVGATTIPYSVALMGGGNRQSVGSNRRGSFIAIGVEDGRVFATAPTATADFAGAPTCLDADNSGFVDTCYIAATDASVWKVTLANDDPASMTMQEFFRANDPTGLSTTGLRAFARVIATFDNDRNINLFYGTGNFEDIRSTTGFNYVVKLIDRDVRNNVPWSAALNGQRINTSCGTSSGRIPLTSAGEKALFDPILGNGVVYFTTYLPDSNPCNPGSGFLYGVRYDSCDPGLPAAQQSGTNPNRSSTTYSGLPMAPVLNEVSGQVLVSYQDRVTRSIDASAATMQAAAQRPMLRLWWRQVQ